MRPPAPAVLGLLLLTLLSPGEATKKPTPCKRCRELVDKFNQVGRSPRGDTRPGVWPGSPHHGLGLSRHLLGLPPP